MNVNLSKPSFHGKLHVQIKPEPAQMLPLLELSINPNVKISEKMINRDKNLHYILETQDKLIPALEQYLTNKNISFKHFANK